MSAEGSAETNVGQTGGSGGSGIVGWRDAYTTLGALDLSNILRDAFSGWGSSSAQSTSGAVTVGDRIIGGKKSSRQLGLVKILALFAGAAVLYKIYKKKKG